MVWGWLRNKLYNQGSGLAFDPSSSDLPWPTPIKLQSINHVSRSKEPRRGPSPVEIFELPSDIRRRTWSSGGSWQQDFADYLILAPESEGQLSDNVVRMIESDWIAWLKTRGGRRANHHALSSDLHNWPAAYQAACFRCRVVHNKLAKNTAQPALVTGRGIFAPPREAKRIGQLSIAANTHGQLHFTPVILPTIESGPTSTPAGIYRWQSSCLLGDPDSGAPATHDVLPFKSQILLDWDSKRYRAMSKKCCIGARAKYECGGNFDVEGRAQIDVYDTDSNRRHPHAVIDIQLDVSRNRLFSGFPAGLRALRLDGILLDTGKHRDPPWALELQDEGLPPYIGGEAGNRLLFGEYGKIYQVELGVPAIVRDSQLSESLALVAFEQVCDAGVSDLRDKTFLVRQSFRSDRNKPLGYMSLDWPLGKERHFTATDFEWFDHGYETLGAGAGTLFSTSGLDGAEIALGIWDNQLKLKVRSEQPARIVKFDGRTGYGGTDLDNRSQPINVRLGQHVLIGRFLFKFVAIDHDSGERH